MAQEAPYWNTGKNGVILAGGGLDGVFGAGVLSAIAALKFPIHHFQAISVGALIGAQFIADGCETAEIENNFRLIEGKLGLSFLFDKSLYAAFSRRNEPGLFSDDGIKALVYGKEGKGWKIRGIDAEKLIASEIEMQIGVHNESEGCEYKIISNRDPEIKKNPKKFLSFLVASSSPQGLVPPQKIDGDYYSDGLYPKIKPSFRAGCNTVLLILNDQPQVKKDIGKEPYLERLRIAFDIMHDKELVLAAERTKNDFPDLRIYNMGSPLSCVKKFSKMEDPVLQYDGQGKPLHKILIVITPKKKIGDLSGFHFKKGDITKAIEHGMEMGSEVLEKLAKLQAPPPFDNEKTT